MKLHQLINFKRSPQETQFESDELATNSPHDSTLRKKKPFVSLFSPVTNKSDPLLLCIKEVEVRQTARFCFSIIDESSLFNFQYFLIAWKFSTGNHVIELSSVPNETAGRRMTLTLTKLFVTKFKISELLRQRRTYIVTFALVNKQIDF